MEWHLGEILLSKGDNKMDLEELKSEANELSIEDLRDLADFCNDLAEALETDQREDFQNK